MNYKIKWRPKSLKELRELPKDIATILVNRVDLCKDNPNHFLEKLVDDSGFKIRVRD